MLYRIETMSLMGMGELPLTAVRGQICAGIDIIVHLGRFRDRSRKVVEICELEKELDSSGKIALNTLFRFEEDKESEVSAAKGTKEERVKGTWRQVGELKDRQKLLAAGLELPAMCG
jgi:pilus assembly protein CpaF